MGSCYSVRQQKETKEITKRFLVDDTHFVSVTVATKAKEFAFQAYETPLSVWIAQGMPQERPDLSELSKRIVSESWVYLRPNMFKIGALMFGEMLAVSLPVWKIFEKFDKDEYAQSNVSINKKKHTSSRAHIDKAMVTLDKMVGALEDPRDLEYIMHELGDRHAEKNVRIEYMDLVMPCFLHAIRPALTEKWANSIEEAWAEFFNHTLHCMKESIVF